MSVGGGVIAEFDENTGVVVKVDVVLEKEREMKVKVKIDWEISASDGEVNMLDSQVK